VVTQDSSTATSHLFMGNSHRRRPRTAPLRVAMRLSKYRSMEACRTLRSTASPIRDTTLPRVSSTLPTQRLVCLRRTLQGRATSNTVSLTCSRPQRRRQLNRSTQARPPRTRSTCWIPNVFILRWVIHNSFSVIVVECSEDIYKMVHSFHIIFQLVLHIKL
jgi:hypothetical protein